MCCVYRQFELFALIVAYLRVDQPEACTPELTAVLLDIFIEACCLGYLEVVRAIVTTNAVDVDSYDEVRMAVTYFMHLVTA